MADRAGFSDDLEQHAYCYLTTEGRVTGRQHRIEIWFAIVDGLLYVNSGGGDRSDWVKNLMANPALEVEVGNDRWQATTTVLDGVGEHVARQRLAERYQGWAPGRPLSLWATDSLLIEIRVLGGS